MTLWRVSEILGDDVMEGYKVIRTDVEGFFEVLNIDMNKFKSTRGLMLGI